MVVKTNTERVRKAVVANLKLLAANHRFECWKCPREHNCEFLKLLRKYQIDNKIAEDAAHVKKTFVENFSEAIAIDSSKCVLCGRCISACEKQAGLGILNYNKRGSKTYVGPAGNYPIEEAGCIKCGACKLACPAHAIITK